MAKKSEIAGFAFLLTLPFAVGIKFAGRRESILGKSYFESEQLLNTKIDDVKSFIANFTLPETGINSIEVSGSSSEVIEGLRKHAEQGTFIKHLVISIKDVSRPESKWLDFSAVNFTSLEELWILVEQLDPRSSVDYCLKLAVNTTTLRSIHIHAKIPPPYDHGQRNRRTSTCGLIEPGG